MSTQTLTHVERTERWRHLPKKIRLRRYVIEGVTLFASYWVSGAALFAAPPTIFRNGEGDITHVVQITVIIAACLWLAYRLGHSLPRDRDSDIAKWEAEQRGPTKAAPEHMHLNSTLS